MEQAERLRDLVFGQLCDRVDLQADLENGLVAEDACTGFFLFHCNCSAKLKLIRPAELKRHLLSPTHSAARNAAGDAIYFQDFV